MNIFKLIYYRSYQFILNKIAAPFLNIKEPKLIKEENSIFKSVSILKENNYKKPFIFVTNSIYKSEVFSNLIEQMSKNNLEYYVYNNIKADPSVKIVEETYYLYKENNCDSIIAIGGGSAIDLAKAVGILVTNKKKNISKYKGLLKVKKKIPFFIAIPTTAGTGSEATICSVITDEKNFDKYAINDPKLIPDYAILDNQLLKSVPQHIISTTGMDALTHAVEAYLGNALTKKTKEYSLKSIKLINENLLTFYNDSNNINSRENVLYASYLAGISFTKSYVGYVHALSHSLGGKYHLSHGYLNAILLPYVLKKYGKKAVKKLKEIETYIDPSNKKEDKDKANDFINRIIKSNEKMNIPSGFKNVIKKGDLDFLVNHAYKEANPLYPVCKELTKKELKEILIESEETLRNIN